MSRDDALLNLLNAVDLACSMYDFSRLNQHTLLLESVKEKADTVRREFGIGVYEE